MTGYKLSFAAEEIDRRLEQAGSSILFTEQTLTEEQKAQARKNIGVEEEGVITTDVQYTFAGDIESDAYTWIYSSTDVKLFMKVADLPDGKINLSGGAVSVVVPSNHWANYDFTITDEMLEQTVELDGYEIKAKVNGLTQVFYKAEGWGDANPMTMVIVCTTPGRYNIALNNFAQSLQFEKTGVYFMTDIPYGGQKYVGSLFCTVTKSDTEEEEEEEENPVEYNGNEIQMFARGVCIGDSITEGVVNHKDGQISIKKYSYPSVLNRITGIEITNAGVSGLTSKTWYEASMDSDPHWGRWVNNEWVWSSTPDVGESDRVSTVFDYSGYDFAIIHLGINDYFTMGGATIEETVTVFETNINNIINKLKIGNAGIKVFLATIIPCYAVSGNTDYAAINEKIREIASITDDVFLIDLNTYSACIGGTAYVNQHLTALGYHKMATEIKSLISYTISKNLEKFKEVQFIGTEYTID